MSDIYKNDYLQHLYSEQYAEDLERVQNVLFASQTGSVLASLTDFTWTSDPTPKRHEGRADGSKTIKRIRLDMDEHISIMDQRLFRRKYRMDKIAFYKLLDILSSYLPSTGEKRKKPGSVSNGPITKSARLSMALRYCAGGDPLDICDHHGVNKDEVLKSVWAVVDAIHKAPR